VVLYVLLEKVGAAVLCEDRAFHNSYLVIAPYSHYQIQAGNSIAFGNFNHSYLSDRICSEYGIRFLKKWAIIRGRNYIRLFEDEQ
jgi:hypothetical protein